MEKFKIKKFMSSFLMLAVMVVSIIGVMPKTAIYADEALELPNYDFRYDDYSHNGYFDLYKWDSSCAGADTVTFWNSEKLSFCNAVISTSPLDASYTYYQYAGKDDGSSWLYKTSENVSHSGSFEARGKTYYYVWYAMSTSAGNIGYKVKKGICYGSKDFDSADCETYIRDYILDKLPTTFTVIGNDGVDTDQVPDGSQDNPVEDKDIGTIVLKSHGFIPTKNNNFIGDVSASYDYYFKYKDKTSSGFSISDNKYARTFIQIRVQNQCVLFEPGNEDTIKEYYPHYGEFYQYKNLATENISDNTVKVSWGDVMSKWSDYTEHPLAVNKKLAYRFMIRVICTDSLTVVPDEKSGWHAGGWRSFLFDGDHFLEETNGHVNDDGTWSDDEDDGHNDSSDKTTNISQDKDKVNENLNDSSTSFFDKLEHAKNAFDTANEYIKQVLKIPVMLGKLFSFFPDWVLYPFEFSFALIPWIIIYKLLRG